jgi:hypothetical protein
MTRFYMDTYPRDNARTKDIVSLSMRSAMLDVRAHRPMSADTFFAHCDHFIKLHPDTSPDVIKRMMAHGLSEAIVFAPEATKDHVCSYLGSSSSDEQLLAAQLLVWMEPLERALAIPWTDSWDHVLSHAGDEPVVRQVVLSRCVDVMVQRWYRSPDPYIRASLLDAASDYASEMSPLSMERVHPLAYVSMALTHDGERDAASRWFASCIHSHVQSTSSQASAFKAGVSGVIKHGMHGDIGLYMDGRCGEQWSIYAKSEGIDIPWFGSREAFTYRRDRVMGPLPFKDMESLVKDMYKKLDADPLVAPL